MLTGRTLLRRLLLRHGFRFELEPSGTCIRQALADPFENYPHFTFPTLDVAFTNGTNLRQLMMEHCLQYYTSPFKQTFLEHYPTDFLIELVQTFFRKNYFQSTPSPPSSFLNMRLLVHLLDARLPNGSWVDHIVDEKGRTPLHIFLSEETRVRMLLSYTRQ
jgi:hypothetical protein